MAEPAFSRRPDVGPQAPWTRDPLLAGCHPHSPQAREETRRAHLLAGALDSLIANGYHGTTINSIVAASGLSHHAFYTQFRGKDDCVLLAYDLGLAWVECGAAAAILAADSWAGQIRVATASTLDLLAADRGLARLLASEILCLGPAGQARRQRLVDRLIPLLRLGRAETPGSRRSTPRLERALVHGAIAVVDREVSAGRGGRLSELAPDLARFLLSPYLDAAQIETGTLDSAPSTAPVLR
jgi:AcrR family transcriptional regulator